MMIIEEIREQSFYLFFLLLGAFSLSENNLKQLGYSEDVYTDYYRLCEYINYHYDNLFMLKFCNDDKEYFKIAFQDIDLKTDDDAQIIYSGVYFKDLGPNEHLIRFSENNLPQEIYLAKWDINTTESDGIAIKPSVVKKIYDNGKFVGPTVAQENTEDY